MSPARDYLRLPAPSPPRPIELAHRTLLVVEGMDDARFLEALLESLGLRDCHLAIYEGKDSLAAFLAALKTLPRFAPIVERIGVVRDADDDPEGAFQSACKALEMNGFKVPAAPGSLTDQKPRVSIFLFPDCQRAGVLETLCLDSLANDPAIKCVQAYIECLISKGLPPPKSLDKAKLQAFLGSKPALKRLLGEAADAGYFPWDHAVFDPLKNFLRNLAA